MIGIIYIYIYIYICVCVYIYIYIYMSQTPSQYTGMVCYGVLWCGLMWLMWYGMTCHAMKCINVMRCGLMWHEPTRHDNMASAVAFDMLWLTHHIVVFLSSFAGSLVFLFLLKSDYVGRSMFESAIHWDDMLHMSDVQCRPMATHDLLKHARED